MENNMDELLRRKFKEGLYDVLDDYITNEFNDSFTYGELYDLFKDYLIKDKLKELLEYLGHDFVDLDELNEEEKEKYY